MATFIYELKSGCLSCDGEYVNIGDVFDFKLKPQPNFPATIRGTVEDIIDVKPGVYEFSYDETLVGGFQLAHCNFDGLPVCLSCCDLLEERIEELEDPDNFKERVIEALDNDGDGDFDANDITGLTQFITNNIANGNITVDASNVTNFATEVAQVITTDPATQTAIKDVVQGGLNDGSIKLPSHTHASEEVTYGTGTVKDALDALNSGSDDADARIAVLEAALGNDGSVDANDVQGFCSKVSECIATGASNNEAIATALAPLLEPKIQIEDLSTNAPAGSRFYSDGNGNVNTTTGVYTTPPATNVGSPIVVDDGNGSRIYSWNGSGYELAQHRVYATAKTDHTVPVDVPIATFTTFPLVDVSDPRGIVSPSGFTVPEDGVYLVTSGGRFIWNDGNLHLDQRRSVHLVYAHAGIWEEVSTGDSQTSQQNYNSVMTNYVGFQGSKLHRLQAGDFIPAPTFYSGWANENGFPHQDVVPVTANLNVDIVKVSEL